MPFDGTKEEDLTLVRGREGLRRLALLLRKELPHNFQWDFAVVYHDVNRPLDERGPLGLSSDCGTAGCAIGLGIMLSDEFRKHLSLAMVGLGSFQELIAKFFEIPENVAGRIFLDRFGYNSDYFRISWGQSHFPVVTPTMVADRIDKYLSTGIVS